jgi:hypothetical protein
MERAAEMGQSPLISKYRNILTLEKPITNSSEYNVEIVFIKMQSYK